MNFDNENSPTHLLDGKNEADPEISVKEKKFPKYVFFIIGNEFCERFSYYGMRTVLTLYLTIQLRFSDNTATVIFHVWSCLCYFTPLFGAMLADSFIGKFNTILYVSILYAVGNIVLAMAATPPLNFPMLEMSMLGLLLIALGTGGIKPCVSAFGGDQFDQDQVRQRQRFFSIFYFSINAGSLISTFLTPVLRADVKCFGGDSCFPLAFGVPAVLLIIAILLFVSGKRMYRIVRPEGNVLLRVFGCVGHALSRRFKAKGEAREHWLDYADDKYDGKFIREVRAALRVMYLYIPLPVFWALYDQQGSRWTLQAAKMDGTLTPSFSIQPDQIQVVNSLFILLCIPIFETIVYPLLAKCNILTKSLRRIFTGGMLAAVAFVVAALLEMSVENSVRPVPSANRFDFTFMNTLPCDVNVTFAGSYSSSVKSFKTWMKSGIPLESHNASLPVAVVPYGCFGLSDVPFGGFTFDLSVEETNAFMTVISGSGDSVHMISSKMALQKSSKGRSDVRIIHDLGVLPPANSSVVLKGKDNSYAFLVADGLVGFTEYMDIVPGIYDVLFPGLNASQHVAIGKTVEFVGGGIYSLLVSNLSHPFIALYTEMEPNKISMFWQIPQYLVITVAEILFSITGLEFSYSQAPVNMKSVLQAAWLMTTAVGDLIVVIVAEAHFFSRQSNEFFLFAGLMVLVMMIFALMAYSYEYVTPDSWTDEGDASKDGSRNGQSVNKDLDRNVSSTEM